MNIILGNVEETITLVDVAENGSSTSRKDIKKHEMLFVRGDGVILVSTL